MSYYLTTITPNSAGVYTISCGFQPEAMKITVSAKDNNTSANAQLSIGQVDNSGYQVYDSIFQDTTGGRSRKAAGKMVSLWSRISGTITEVCAAEFDSFTATQAKFNVTKPNILYQYTVEVWG